MYYFIDWRAESNGEGIEPDLPEDSDFSFVAECDSPRKDWAIFHCHIEDDTKYTKVSPLLDALLCSATRYPPVMALARNKIFKATAGKTLSKKEFEDDFIDVINDTIDICKRKQLVFSKAKEDEIGYLTKNEFYWVISCTLNQSGDWVANWVSDDHFIYSNPVSAFNISEEELDVLKNNA